MVNFLKFFHIAIRCFSFCRTKYSVSRFLFSTVRFRQFCEFCWSSIVDRVLRVCCVRVSWRQTPMFEQELTLGDVLELSADELRDELAGRDIDPKGMSKVEMQKAFIKILFPVVPVAPVVAQPVSPLTALSPQQLMELEVMKL